MNNTRFGKNGIDMEMVFIMVTLSIIFSIGLYALFGILTGVAIMELGAETIGGIILGMSGIFFGILSLTYINRYR